MAPIFKRLTPCLEIWREHRASVARLSPDQESLHFARALAASEMWDAMPALHIVIRRDGEIAIAGETDEAGAERVIALEKQLMRAGEHLCYVSFEKAAADSVELGRRLEQVISDEDRVQTAYLPVPRGGHIVYGMLAYVLGGAPTVISDRVKRLVLVDDCIISGRRIGSYLRAYQNSRIVIATLYSHPSARKALLEEPNVEACISAADLTDFAPEQLGEGYSDWLDRWKGRSEEPTWWHGRTEFLCFAWNEPDINLWNETLGRTEPAWRIVPDDLCLKNRPRRRDPALRIQYQLDSSGVIQPAPHVLYSDLGHRIVVGSTETGEVLPLDGTAVEFWRALTQKPTEAAALVSLQEIYDVADSVLRRDMDAFRRQAAERGLIR